MDINPNELSVVIGLFTIGGSYAVMKYQVGELVKKNEKFVTNVEFEKFQSELKEDVRAIKRLLGEGTGGVAVFMRREDCNEHKAMICNFMGDINATLKDMNEARNKARAEDQHNMNTLHAEVKLLKQRVELAHLEDPFERK
jgi:hypothetical protein